MSLSSSTSHPTSTSTDKYDTLHFSIQKYVLNNLLCLLSTTMFTTVLYIQHYHILHSFRRSGPGVIVIHVMQAPFTNPLSSTPHHAHYGSDFLFISKHSSAASVPAFSVLYFEDYNRLILSTSTYTERITSHSPSHFYCPTEVALHTLQPTSPGHILWVSQCRRYPENISYSLCIPRSVRLLRIYDCHNPSLWDLHIVDSMIPASDLPTATYL